MFLHDFCRSLGRRIRGGITGKYSYSSSPYEGKKTKTKCNIIIILRFPYKAKTLDLYEHIHHWVSIADDMLSLTVL